MTNTDIWMISLTGLIAIAGVVSATIFNNQLSVMQGQLDEMEASGKQNDALIETNKKLAEAAKNSADTSREALVKSQRAFVRSAGFPWLWRPDFDRPGKYFFDIGPIIENAGATPTVDMTTVVNFALRETPLPDGFDFPYAVEPESTLVGPRQTIGASRVHILDDDLVAVQNGKKFFYIWGTIKYRDVFDGTPLHTTDFCTQITRVLGNPLDPGDPAIGPRATSVEITFSIYKEHNKTD